MHRQLGHYELIEKIGAGGMGEVFRARDTRLGREVALKLLPEAFAADADRLTRFEREARVVASLNHPNIAAIHGFEHVERHAGSSIWGRSDSSTGARARTRSPPSQRFLVVKRLTTTGMSGVVVVENWFSEFAER